jgi:uncharacterized protein YerC
MGRVSKKPLHPKVRMEISQIIIRGFSKIIDEGDMAKLLRDLLTPSEKIMLGKRLMAAILLERGYSYTAISMLLKLTPGTINVVRRELDKGGEGYRIVVRLLERKESKLEKIFEKIDALLGAMTLPIKGSRSSKRRWHRDLARL